jgi:hypothetical protein
MLAIIHYKNKKTEHHVMNSLRNMSISRRLWLILVVAVMMLLALGVLMLKQIHDDLYVAKARKPSMWCRPPVAS